MLCDVCGQAVTFEPSDAFWLRHREEADHDAAINPIKALDFAREFWEEDKMQCMHNYMWAYVVLESGALNADKAMDAYKYALEYIVDDDGVDNESRIN